jgi:hypothetical protein
MKEEYLKRKFVTPTKTDILTYGNNRKAQFKLHKTT